MEILKTFDHSIFKSITSNREVDDRHVKRLVKAIRAKNMLNINPIIVNSNFEVIDGQHRLEAAREIGGIYIYYVIDDRVNKGDIGALNSNAKNWTVMDYINYFTIEKRPGFDKLSAFISEYPMIPPSTVLHMLSADGSRNAKALKEGMVDSSNYNFAVKVARILKEYRNLIDHAYDRNFVLAVIEMVKHPDYNHDNMRAKLEYQSRSLVKCINQKQYLDMLTEIYNYKNSKNILKF